jgi:hypothetical protein
MEAPSVVSYLTEELVRQGHDVTLFASADSETSARLVPCSSGLSLDDNHRHIAWKSSALRRFLPESGVNWRIADAAARAALDPHLPSAPRAATEHAARQKFLALAS